MSLASFKKKNSLIYVQSISMWKIVSYFYSTEKYEKKRPRNLMFSTIPRTPK
jgi:hypothetical protein